MSRIAPAENARELPESFEDAMSELESLIGQMEAGRLPLEDSLAAYRRGVELVRHCRDRLAAVTQQVEVLDAGLLVPYGEDGKAAPDERMAPATSAALQGASDDEN